MIRMFKPELLSKLAESDNLLRVLSFAFGCVFGGTLLGLSINKILKLMIRGYM